MRSARPATWNGMRERERKVREEMVAGMWIARCGERGGRAQDPRSVSVCPYTHVTGLGMAPIFQVAGWEWRRGDLKRYRNGAHFQVAGWEGRSFPGMFLSPPAHTHAHTRARARFLTLIAGRRVISYKCCLSWSSTILRTDGRPVGPLRQHPCQGF